LRKEQGGSSASNAQVKIRTQVCYYKKKATVHIKQQAKVTVLSKGKSNNTLGGPWLCGKVLNLI
jgi:hypothetical protein